MREIVISKFFWNFQIFYCVRKKGVQGICYLHLIRYNFFIFQQGYFSLDLFFSERNGFTVCQNFLLSVKFFSFNFAKYCFFSFLRRVTQKFLYLVKANLFFQKSVSKTRSFHDRLRQCFSHERFIIPADVLFFLQHDGSVHSGIY